MSIVVGGDRLARDLAQDEDTAPPGGSRGRSAGAPRAVRAGSTLLRRSLRIADAAALTLAWSITQLWWSTPSSSLGVRLLVGLLPFVVAGCWLISNQRLYLARVATMRTVEQAGLARVCVVLMAGAAALDGIRGVAVLPVRILVTGGLAFVFLSLARAVYRGWLTAARRTGRFIRPVLIVGIDEQTSAICSVIADHPELGFEAVGVVGAHGDAMRSDLGQLWLGELSELADIVGVAGVTGAIVSSTALDPTALNDVTRMLLERRCHVHLSTGITCIDQRRIKPVHLGYEPLIYLERLELSRSQLLAKRVLDVVISAVVAVLVSPLIGVSAVAIKLDDRGQVFFRQRRVGRDGELFTIYKLRTMTAGAEEHLDELLPYNERNGPLFKMEDDPRITRVGRLLRGLSIDELPQLWNVLRGEMSLVGPRPALPSEALCFGEALQARTQVQPGITGLWQVEANDSASMLTYERLDLFYVENWSVGLDVMVIIATIEEELVKLARHLKRARRAPREASSPSTASARALRSDRPPLGDC